MKKFMHGNVIKFIESFYDTDNRLCMVMEYCDGGDLKKFIKNER